MFFESANRGDNKIEPKEIIKLSKKKKTIKVIEKPN